MGIGAGRKPSPAGRDRARPLQGNQSRAVYGGVWSPRLTGARQVVPSSRPMWASAPTGGRRGFSNHPGQRRTAERLRQRSRGNGWESRQRSSPKCPATSDNPSVTAAPCQLPLHKGALGDGGCGLPRRPCGPPRSDNGFLSFRGAERRGNPSFFTMDGGSGRRTKDDGNGTPRTSAPTERRESPINHPSQPARSEAFAPAWARDGRESAQRPSQKGDRLRDCRCSA